MLPILIKFTFPAASESEKFILSCRLGRLGATLTGQSELGLYSLPLFSTYLFIILT